MNWLLKQETWLVGRLIPTHRCILCQLCKDLYEIMYGDPVPIIHNVCHLCVVNIRAVLRQNKTNETKEKNLTGGAWGPDQTEQVLQVPKVRSLTFTHTRTLGSCYVRQQSKKTRILSRLLGFFLVNYFSVESDFEPFTLNSRRSDCPSLGAK